MKYFITYGDAAFDAAKRRIVNQAESLGIFDEVIAYSPADLSLELQQSEVMQIKRGGGLWSWKPDVILTTLQQMQYGDIVVYCDAGCTLQKAREWARLWKRLESHDMIAQRIYQRVDQWTRKEILDLFEATNGVGWHRSYQFMATIQIIKKSEMTMRLVQEWRSLILEAPVLVQDVLPEEIHLQSKHFIENRHDQSVFSALIYKHLKDSNSAGRIYTQWEHVENKDIFCRQAIRATRLRNGELPTPLGEVRQALKRLCKDWLYKPFVIYPKYLYNEWQCRTA